MSKTVQSVSRGTTASLKMVALGKTMLIRMFRKIVSGQLQPMRTSQNIQSPCSHHSFVITRTRWIRVHLCWGRKSAFFFFDECQTGKYAGTANKEAAYRTVRYARNVFNQRNRRLMSTFCFEPSSRENPAIYRTIFLGASVISGKALLMTDGFHKSFFVPVLTCPPSTRRGFY
jgi:hypothetical protein